MRGAPPGGRSDPGGSTHAVPNGRPPPTMAAAMAPPPSARGLGSLGEGRSGLLRTAGAQRSPPALLPSLRGLLPPQPGPGAWRPPGACSVRPWPHGLRGLRGPDAAATTAAPAAAGLPPPQTGFPPPQAPPSLTSAE